MAKSEGTRKPRLGNLDEVTLDKPLAVARGSAVYRSKGEHPNCASLVADYDAHLVRIKLKVGGTHMIPFSKCQDLRPGMGSAKE